MKHDELFTRIQSLSGQIKRANNPHNDEDDRVFELEEFNKGIGFIEGYCRGLVLALDIATKKPDTQTSEGL